MIMICLTQAVANFNVSVPLELINMTGTYYQTLEINLIQDDKKVVKKSKKIYLMDKIKDHKVFKSLDFWQACLIYSIAESKDGYDFHDVRYSIEQSIVKSGYVNQVVNNFMTLSMHMKEFGLPD